jgi:hypothetical protein
MHSDRRTVHALSQMRFVPEYELRDEVCRVQADFEAQHVSSTQEAYHEKPSRCEMLAVDT